MEQRPFYVPPNMPFKGNPFEVVMQKVSSDSRSDCPDQKSPRAQQDLFFWQALGNSAGPSGAYIIFITVLGQVQLQLENP